MLHITRGVYETSFHLSIFHESIYKRATIFNQNQFDGDSQISNSLFRLFRQSLEDYQDSPLKTISSHHQSPVSCPIDTVEVAGLDSGYAGDRRAGGVASFYKSPSGPNHTHLGPYTRTVSLHRVISPSHDSSIDLLIHHESIIAHKRIHVNTRLEFF